MEQATTIAKLQKIVRLLQDEMDKLSDCTNENSENFDSEYITLDDNGVNAFEAEAALKPIYDRIVEIIGIPKSKMV